MKAQTKEALRQAAAGGTWVLLAANLAVFIAVHAAYFCGVSEMAIARAVTLPAEPMMWLRHPWTAVTYMFVQWDFTHLLFNMVWLWSFGVLASRLMVRGRTVFAAYAAGGLAAAAVFVLTGALRAGNGILLGSSAAVLGVVCATGVLRGRCTVTLILLGSVQVRWLAAGVTALVLITSVADKGTAEVCAHAAGAIAGVLTGLIEMRRRRRVIRPADMTPKPFGRRGAEYGPRPRKGLLPAEQAELDGLLDVVRRGGYNALSVNQRIRLFDLSSKIK